MIEVKIERNLNTKVNILTFSYNGKVHFMPLTESGLSSYIELSELRAQQLMNLCIDALRDFKDHKIRREAENKDKVKFYGVDYS